MADKIFLDVFGTGVGKDPPSDVVIAVLTHQLQHELALCQLARSIIDILQTLPHQFFDRAMHACPLEVASIKMLTYTPVRILCLPNVEFSIFQLKHVQVTGSPL